MTNDEVERAIEFLLKWQAEYTVRFDMLTDRIDKLSIKVDKVADNVDRVADNVDRITSNVDRVIDTVDKLAESTARNTKVSEVLMSDRDRIVQLIELQSRR